MAKRSSKRKLKAQKTNLRSDPKGQRARIRESLSKSTEDVETLFLETFEITVEPLPDSERDALPDHIQNEGEKICREFRSNPVKYIGRLEELVEQYPNYKPFQNWLITSFTVQGEKEQAMAMAKAMLVEFPDYFYGKVSLALMYLDEFDFKHLDTVDQLLGGKYKTPGSLDPNRKLFHVSEIRAYFFAVAKYHCFNQDWEAASKCREILVDVIGEGEETNQIDRLMSKKSRAMINVLWAGFRAMDRAA